MYYLDTPILQISVALFFLAELCIKFQEESLVQELAELLVIALAGYRPRNSTKGDQEAFVVTITGRSYVS